MKKFFTLMSILLVCGCSAATIQDIKSNYAYNREVVVQKNLEQTFKIVKDMLDESYPAARSVLYSTHGELSIGHSGGYNLFIEVIKVSENITSVKFYAYIATWKARIDGWAQRLESPP